jgi:hypothetical protein
MIRIECAGCGAKLNAKDELAGQTRKCPKCGQPIKIPAPEAAEGTPPNAALETQVFAASESETAVVAKDAVLGDGASEAVAASAETATEPAHVHRPERLNRHHRYLICGPSHLVATWESDGHGWMIRTTAGMGSAARNRDKIPTEGDFRLVELKLDHADAGLRLTGIAVYQLARRWALANLVKSDDAIVTAITGPGILKREHKNAIREVLREHYMREVWHGATRVMEYLTNADTHSHGVDEEAQTPKNPS